MQPENPGRNSHAHIIDIDGKLLVRPSVVVLRKNEEFRLCNLTDSNDVQVCFEDPNVRPNWFPIEKSRKHGRVMSMDPGVYRYKVTVGGRPAHGESDPVIIIDPPGN
jgi:hypothetical protein